MEMAELVDNLGRENKFKVLEATRTSRSNIKTLLKRIIRLSQPSSINLLLFLRIRLPSKTGRNRNQLDLKRNKMSQLSICREARL